MRRLLFALLLGFVPTPSLAGEVYFETYPTGTICAANESTRASRVVLNSSEFPHGQIHGMTRFNHAASNGQALLQFATTDLQLIYRASNGAVVTKMVTNLAGNVMKPRYPISMAQDDSFFSFKGEDGNGRESIWRLNVTTDQALDPGFVPPSSFDDPRLQLVVDEHSGTTAIMENYVHRWSPDGTRLAYLDRWTNAAGTRINSIRVKAMASGSTDPLSDVSLRDVSQATGTMLAVLQWSPGSDQILICDRDGGLWIVHADTPGAFTWVAKNVISKVGTSTVTETAKYPRWRADGQKIGFSYGKVTVSKTGATTTASSPAEMGANGWPAVLYPGIGNSAGEKRIYGWTP